MVDLRIELPEHFFEEEVRDGYTVSAEMKKVWAVELDMLAEFRRVCDKYGLRWFADGGTLLGAVRHKGFIPWDNDIDISMPRKDYDRLCAVAPHEFSHPYFFQTSGTDKYYYRLHAQLRNSMTTGILYGEIDKLFQFNQGVFIDIFPFDNVPDCDEDMASFGQIIRNTNRKLYFHNYYKFAYQKSCDPKKINRIKDSIKHLLTVLFCKGNSRSDRLFKKTVELIKSYRNVDTKRFANLSLPDYTISRSNFFHKEWYYETVYLPFEFIDIPAPSGYVEYLDMLYGNWHEFVISGALHGDTFFDVDKPYTHYLNLEGEII